MTLFTSVKKIISVVTFCAIILVSFASHNIVFAVRVAPFSPGETLDPGSAASPCGPFDSNCYPSSLRISDEGSSIGALGTTIQSVNFVGSNVATSLASGILTVTVSNASSNVTLPNGATITNASTGVVAIGAPTAILTDLQLNTTLISFPNGTSIGANIPNTIQINALSTELSGDLVISGNDLIFGNGEGISNTPDGSLVSTLSPTGSFNVLTGNVKIGDGTPSNTLDGEDLYVEGGIETDGTLRVDGITNLNGNITLGDAALDTIAINGTITTDLQFEGVTADNFETTLSVVDPTADNIIYLPNASGTLMLANGSGNLTGLSGMVFNNGEGIYNTPDGTIVFQDGATNLFTVVSSGGLGNGTFTGDLAVQGGDITSSSSLLTINAGGNVDIQDILTADSLVLDTGGITLQNGETINNTIDGIVSVGVPVTGYMEILNGNMKVGNGTPTLPLNGEDFYVEGTLETGGNALIGGTQTIVGDLNVNGGDINSTAGTLVINAGGTVDIQDNVTADSLTLDTGGLTLSNAETITNAVDGTILLTAPTTSLTGDITIQGNDLTFGNGESISNSTDGTLLFTSPTSSFTGDVTITGNDLSFGNGETLSNATDGTILATLAATGSFEVSTGNLKVGNGTPDVALNGEDAYVEGTFETDGNARFDGAVTLGDSSTDLVTFNGNIATSTPFSFEGSTVDANYLSFVITNPTAIRQITFPDATGTVLLGGADTIDFSDLSDNLTLDASTQISAGAFNLTTNLTGTGDFVIQDNGSTVFSVLDSGTTQIDGPLVANGNTTLGDFSTDTVTANATSTFNNDVTIGSSNTDFLTINSTLSGSGLVFEGSINDTFETTLAVLNPTADRTISFPDADGTVLISNGSGVLTGLNNVTFVNGEQLDNTTDGFIKFLDNSNNVLVQIQDMGTTGNFTVSGDAGITGDLTVNGGDINSTAGTLVINAGGTVDIQDNVTADSLTLDTGGLTLSNAETITNAVDGTILLTAPTTSLTGDITIQGNDLTFGNGESISNSTDGTLLFTSPTSSFTGDVTITGNDLSFGNGETLSNATDGTILATLAATGSFEVSTGNLKVGNGTPDVALNGEDAYVEGTFETDGNARFDGVASFNNAVSMFSTLQVNGFVGLGDAVGDIVTIAGDLGVNGGDITSSAATLVINAGGAVTIQDQLTVDSFVVLSTGASTLNGSLTVGGQIILGDNGDLASIDSSIWDITSAGVASGFTGFTSTGNITVSGAEIQGTNALVFEGSVADGFETTFALTNPTADRTITFPDTSGTVLLAGADSIDYDSLVNAMTVDENTSVSLGANTLTYNVNGTTNMGIDLQSTGDFVILDNGVVTTAFYDNGNVDFLNAVTMYGNTTFGDAITDTVTIPSTVNISSGVINSSSTTLTINAGGNIDLQDAVSAESLTLSGNITLENLATITNSIPGKLFLTAPTVQLSNNLELIGNNITFGNSESLSNATDGTILATLASTGSFEISTGNLKVGNGTPSNTLDGEDVYVEGGLEVDGAARYDGGININIASGTVVPETITNDGTGNSFVVNDVTADASYFFVDASGRVGVQSSGALSNAFTIGINGSESVPAFTMGSADSDTGIFKPSADTIGFSTSGTEKVRITSGGSLAIGTISASSTLHVVGTVRFASIVGAGANLVVDASGNVTASSDERLKDISGNFTRGIESLRGIEPINYHWNAASGYDQVNSYTGFSAQNIQANIPEAVGTSANGYLNLAERPILATIVNAVKYIDKILTDFKESITTKKIFTEEICVGSTCLNEQELIQLKSQMGNQVPYQSPVNPEGSDAPVVVPTEPETPPLADPIITPESPVIPEVIIPEPIIEIIPEVTI